MAATEQQIKDITGSTLADAVITPFLTTAQAVLAQLSECTASLPTATVDLAEAYLGAHFLTTSPVGDGSKQVRRESLDAKYMVEYLTPFNMGDGVLGTQYGQTANLLLGGCLAQMDKYSPSIQTIGSIGDDA